MRELFYSLGVIALLRYLGICGITGAVLSVALVASVLILDYILKRNEIEAQAKLEAFKLSVMREK